MRLMLKLDRAAQSVAARIAETRGIPDYFYIRDARRVAGLLQWALQSRRDSNAYCFVQKNSISACAHREVIHSSRMHIQGVGGN